MVSDPELRLAMRRCWLGTAGIVVSPAGIRAVELADDPEAVHAALSARYGTLPQATDDWCEDFAEAALAAVEGAPLRVALDPSGTEFQRLVWRELRGIPCGQTRSYAELAASIGRPSASRAVARACATNEIAVIVPCHRVVRSDGAMSGYRWGVKRKAMLLQREAEL